MRATALVPSSFATTLTIALACAGCVRGGDAACIDGAATCGAPAPERLEQALAAYHDGATQALGAGAACLEPDRDTWLRDTYAACADDACRREASLRRLAELDPLQPGVSRLRDIPLPADVPALVAALPPAEDEVAAPRPDAPTPLVASGTLAYDAEAGGYALRDSHGAATLVAMDMFLGGDTSDALARFAAETDAQYLAHGTRAIDDRGRAYFEPGACVLIYRQPESATAPVR